MWPVIVGAVVFLLLVAISVFLYSRFGDLISSPAIQDEIQARDNVVLASNLHVPWSIAFMPNGTLLATQRNGLLTMISPSGKVDNIDIQGTTESGEGGLLGLAVHPQFTENNYIYLYYTANSKGNIINRVVRCILKQDSVAIDRLIINNIPGGKNHNGGRLAFGPDGYLYVTTGDAEQENLAQDVNSLAGKILRVNDDGSIPVSNPFQNAVYSYGHRNPQGVVWDDLGGMWSTEHGRSGLLSGYDEINYIQIGKNYGWPVIQGDASKAGMTSPILHSGSSTTWAPAGIAYRKGYLYFGGLLGQALYRVQILGPAKLGPLQTMLKNVYGRIRAVAVSPTNNQLIISTSNNDGRGIAREDDDKIIQINE